MTGCPATKWTSAMLLSLLINVIVHAGPLRSNEGPDEGMWSFDNIPSKLLKERYGFVPTQEWLDHVRLSSVRFNDGGSGSFVSPNGLTLTNHHVARGQLQKMSSAQKDYLKDGFYASSAAEEIKCADLELNVLESTENVTGQMNEAVAKAKNSREALELRKAEFAKIEKESSDKSGLRSDVITFYNGGEYWLYRYKKYTDVRLVFAPESQIAFYGGDPDNFTYPRYDLDMAIFRVYENGEPLHPKQYLAWSAAGAKDSELVFVSGNPGSTDRQSTVAQLEFERDNGLPMYSKNLRRLIALLRDYSKRGAEQARQIQAMLYGAENSLKAVTGEYSGLLDKAIIGKKKNEEEEFQSKIASNPLWQKEYGDTWDVIAQAEKLNAGLSKQMGYRGLRGSRLSGIARTIVQYVAEVKKPNGDRLEPFRESNLESLGFNLLSPAPLYPELEEARLVDALQQSVDELGPDDESVKMILDGRTPAEAAKALIGGTKLFDVPFRKSLIDGGEQAVAASTDPMIIAARKLDPMMRSMQKESEAKVRSVLESAGEKLGKARFAVYGKSNYPDATFTLRLTFGTVKGYQMNGTQAPPKTTMFGLFDRAESFNFDPPFDLPARYRDRREKIDLSTPMNFVATTDVVGGNSGSPVINKNAELVGLVFDGNIESLVGAYVYNEENNRTVAVHSRAMIEALRKLYDASPLADELEGKPAH